MLFLCSLRWTWSLSTCIPTIKALVSVAVGGVEGIVKQPLPMRAAPLLYTIFQVRVHEFSPCTLSFLCSACFSPHAPSQGDRENQLHDQCAIGRPAVLGCGLGFYTGCPENETEEVRRPRKISAHRKGTLSKTWKSPRVFPGCSRASDLFAKRSSSQWMGLSHRAAGPIFTFLPRMQSNFHQIALQPLIRPTRRVQVVATSILQRVRRLLLAATTCCAYWLLSGLLDLFERPLVTDGTSEEGEDSKEE
jgi:hypothetical protein